MKSKYSDSNPLYTIERGYNEATRMLKFHSTPLDADTLQEALDIIGQYNEFNPKTVGTKLLQHFPKAKFVVGRENSPVVYVHTTETWVLELHDLGKEIKADEVTIENNQIRFWFD